MYRGFHSDGEAEQATLIRFEQVSGIILIIIIFLTFPSSFLSYRVLTWRSWRDAGVLERQTCQG